MTIEEIRKGAPPEATHYIIDGGDYWYFKYDGVDVYLWHNKWIKAVPNVMLGNEKPL